MLLAERFHLFPATQDLFLANVALAFQKHAGSLAFSIQSPPRDCLRGQQPLAHSLEDALASCSTRSLPEQPCALVGRSRWGAGPRKRCGLPWDFQQSFAVPKQRLQGQELASLSIGAHLAQVPQAMLNQS